MSTPITRLFGPADVASGDSTIFTGPGGKLCTVKSLVILNSTAGTISIKLGVNGIGDSDLILPFVAIGPGEWAVCTEILPIADGETLEAHTDADGLTITGSGLEQVA